VISLAQKYPCRLQERLNDKKTSRQRYCLNN
jgi:hypothetical protein